MRVGLNALLAHRGEDYRAAGVSVYTEQLIRHLPAAAPENEYWAYVGPDGPDLPGARRIVSPLPTERPLVRIAWEQTGLSLQVRRARLDLFHATVNVLPLFRSVPCVLTVHDLSFLRYPETFPKAKAFYQRHATLHSARVARRIIAVSESTKQDLVELGGIPERQVEVIHAGVGEQFRPLDTGVAGRPPETSGRPYILHVGTLQPRKNLDVLIRAFAEVKRTRDIPHVLALVGARGWMYEDLHRLAADLRLEGEVRFVDYVPPERLPLWYNCAELLAYPSAYEGFGLPVLEAMACGTPVVTSASSSLVEVAGDAARLVTPGSVEDLAAALDETLHDDAQRASLRSAGLRRARGFSWMETARKTAAVYERVGRA